MDEDELERMIDRPFIPATGALVELRNTEGKPFYARLVGHALADAQFTGALARVNLDLLAENDQLRAQLDQQAERKPTPNEVIEKYYRRRARNPKITLKRVCVEMGVNYHSIRTAKVAYDKRRKRGHKD